MYSVAYFFFLFCLNKNYNLKVCLFFLSHIYALLPHYSTALYGLCMDLQHHKLLLKKKKNRNDCWAVSRVCHKCSSVFPLRLPCSCSSTKRTNERLATAFPLIVISLSQGELSRDRARTEQFSSPPIPAATVFQRRSG